MVAATARIAPDSRSHDSFRSWRAGHATALAGVVWLFALAAPSGLRAQQPAASGTTMTDRPPRAWVQAAAAYEAKIIDDDGSQPLRFRIHKIDAKGDTVRVQVETREGSVARLVERNGQPLTVAEDAAEQERLRDILASPEAFVRHHKRDAGTRDDTLSLVRLMPGAMRLTYAPGQPQWHGFSGQQVVIDFQPDPAFRPPNLAADMLTGLAGRLWIDPRSGRMLRVEARVLKPVNFGWGLIGRIYPGGTLVLEQANAVGERWLYSHLDMHLNMRVVVKSVAFNDQITAGDFQPLPAPLTVQQAVDLLLEMHIPTR
jgi:hypothetical protein